MDTDSVVCKINKSQDQVTFWDLYVDESQGSCEHSNEAYPDVR